MRNSGRGYESEPLESGREKGSNLLHNSLEPFPDVTFLAVCHSTSFKMHCSSLAGLRRMHTCVVCLLARPRTGQTSLAAKEDRTSPHRGID